MPHDDISNSTLLAALCGVIVSSTAAATAAILTALHSTERKIMSTQAEQAQQIRDLTAQVTKTRNETLAKIAALQTALDNAGGTTPEVDAAMAELKAAVQLSDDDVPDAPQAPDA